MSLCIWLALPIFCFQNWVWSWNPCFHCLKQPYLKTINFDKTHQWAPRGGQRRGVRHVRMTRWEQKAAGKGTQVFTLLWKGPAAMKFPGKAEPSGFGGTMNSKQLPEQGPPSGICPCLPSPMVGMWLFPATTRKRNTMNCFKISPRRIPKAGRTHTLHQHCSGQTTLLLLKPKFSMWLLEYLV